MSNSLTVRLTESRSRARSAPISYTPPVNPPPPRTSALRDRLARGRRAAGCLVFDFGRSVAAVSSLTTFPMLSWILWRRPTPASLLPPPGVSYQRMRRLLPALGALIWLLAAAPAWAATPSAHSAQSSLAATLSQDMSQIGGGPGDPVADPPTPPHPLHTHPP